MRILVTGKKGQLASEIHKISSISEDIEWIFSDTLLIHRGDKFFLAQAGENLQLVVFYRPETACAAVAVS